MNDALIGCTGLVGGTLLARRRFAAAYRSTTIDGIAGRTFDRIYCAGAPAEKWKANRDPDADRANLARLVDTVSRARARKLILISTIILALILYTLTLDKIHDIAMLKLMGARNSMIIGLILQQALLIGTLGYALAYWLGLAAFPKFPRLVVIETPDLIQLAVIVVGICVLASLVGIVKAMRVEANKVLS